MSFGARLEIDMEFIKKYIEAAYFCVIVFALIFVFVLNTYDKETDAGMYGDYEIINMNEEWKTFDNSGKVNNVSLPLRLNMDVNNSCTIYRTVVDEIEEGDSICFRTENQRVLVMIDANIIYDYYWSNDIPLGNNPGSVWNIVKLKPEYRGKTLIIRTYSDYSLYNGYFSEVYFGSRSDVILYVMGECFWSYTISCIPFVLGILLLCIAPFAKRVISSKPIVTLGILLVDIGVWEVIESGFLQFSASNTYTMSTMAMVAFGLIPVLLVKGFNTINFITTNYKKIFLGNVAVFMVYMLSLLTGIADLKQSVWLIHILLAVDAVHIYKDTKKYFKELDDVPRYVIVSIAYYVTAAAALVDIYSFYVIPNAKIGECTRYAIILFILLLSIVVVYTSLDIQKNNIEKATIINMAYTDNLTGIRNRRCFEEDTEKLVDEKVNFTVIAVDMNNLKKINDELGHKFGDEALIKVANGLKKFEKYGEKCYRMGGDEFEVLCTHLGSEKIEEVFQEINAELGKTEFFPGMPLTVAYGYFRFSATTDKEINKVLAQADKKMYEKKMQMKAMGVATRD